MNGTDLPEPQIDDDDEPAAEHVHPVEWTARVRTDYSLGRTPDGQWFAIGSVRNTTVSMLIGTGSTRADAIADLNGKMNRYPQLA